MVRENLKRVYFFIRRLVLKSAGIFIDKSEKAITDKEQKIFIYGLKRLGDMVMSLPVFDEIRNKFKDAFIVLAASEYNRGIADGKYFDEIITQPSGFYEAGKFISQLKSYKFDIGIDLTCDYDIFPAFAIYRSGAKIRVGYDAEGRGIFFTRALSSDFKGKHVLVLIMNLVGVLISNPEPEISNPKYEPSEDNIEYAKKYLEKMEIVSTIIGIHPGGHYPSQIWAMEKFAGAIDEIKRRDLGDVIIFGTSPERTLVNGIMGFLRIAKPFLILDEPIGKLAAFIKLCDVFLCNNSGPLHLAASMEVPTVSIMGPTDYDLWHPLGERNIVIRKNIECSPCNLAVCREHNCMNLITVEEIMDAIERQLKG